MDSKYEDEESSLRIQRVLFEFPAMHLNRFMKRIFYNYFLRDFNAASLHLILGVTLTLSGAVFGIANWIKYSGAGTFAPTGTVVLATLQLILGIQFLLSWVNYDVNTQPLKPLAKRLGLTRAASNTDQMPGEGEETVNV
jgi:hypothetical protein